MRFWAVFWRGRKTRTTIGGVSAEAAWRSGLCQVLQEGRVAALYTSPLGDVPAEHHTLAAGADYEAASLLSH